MASETRAERLHDRYQVPLPNSTAKPGLEGDGSGAALDSDIEAGVSRIEGRSPRRLYPSYSTSSKAARKLLSLMRACGGTFDDPIHTEGVWTFRCETESGAFLAVGETEALAICCAFARLDRSGRRPFLSHAGR